MSSNMGTISSHETEALTIMGRGLRDNLPGPETDVLNFRANDNTIFYNCMGKACLNLTR